MPVKKILVCLKKQYFLKSNFLLIVFYFALSASFLYSAPKVAFYKLKGKNISVQLEKTVNEVIFSFTRELKNYSIEDYREMETETISDNIDFVFTGNIIGLENGIKLELILKNADLAVTRLISKEYENSSKILLESRVLVKDLFDQTSSLNVQKKDDTKNSGSKNTELIPIADIDSLAGAWYGEEEIEKVMIMRGGRGVAVWISGISLLLDLKIQEGSLIITQKGSPQPRQFINLPDNIALLASKAVKPIVWEFKTDSNKKLLTGLKKTYSIKHNNTEILEISEITVPIVWTKD